MLSRTCVARKRAKTKCAAMCTTLSWLVCDLHLFVMFGWRQFCLGPNMIVVNYLYLWKGKVGMVLPVLILNAIRWLDSNTLAEKDELEHRLQELQRTCSPVMTKLHQQGQTAGAGAQSARAQGPTVEEVD